MSTETTTQPAADVAAQITAAQQMSSGHLVLTTDGRIEAVPETLLAQSTDIAWIIANGFEVADMVGITLSQVEGDYTAEMAMTDLAEGLMAPDAYWRGQMDAAQD